MSQDPVVVVLTDGEANLAHYMDLLRREGHRVLATSRPYEAVLFVARNPASCLIARLPLLPEPHQDFLRQVRDLSPRLFVVLCSPAGLEPERAEAVADLRLAEPFLYSTLREALEYGAERARATERTHAAGAPAAPAPGRFLASARRLLECCRRLSELERDRDQLLTTGLEMFLEIVAAHRGSILLRSADGEWLEFARRCGFPEGSEVPERIRIGTSFAGEVALTGRPLIVTDADPPSRPEYQGRSFLVVPLMDQKTVLGVVNLTDRQGGEAFTAEDLDVVATLAHQFAVNLDNAGKWEDLHRMAVVDPLTGLFNRRFFDRQIAIELERARRYDRQVSLALIDIDHFKVINDINGYAAGDRVIALVAQVIRSSFREVDIVTRWGGDEFAVLLPETGKPRASRPGEPPTVNFVERVREAVEEGDYHRAVPNLSGRITVSAGVATFPLDGQDRDALFAVANHALLRAKRSGHNRVCVAGEESA